ncbi:MULTISPECIES: Rieske (2Fe-2S) protein [Haloarcula]|uniref:(2Fe-2S) ferredoxin n=1 Tax=Haloarcula pellucida TaxID=1427151 RepID=A0A830GH10_9EURY|nr:MULTISPECIES: Rieske 2Fe-2S domain-containing protein [Halomicroarcula]MBX0346958.1 Rieske 2Fe-2S domain-containing protein [Halomicroarcula pellucida]MDS0277167.1 Rieske 2Fe-2S domain-containing protein [Halomicroarcula sp. S1AR25-4]GGN86275.1 (2Fe-2S) ferredoxin [Halomicroarcula pellucida]
MDEDSRIAAVSDVPEDGSFLFTVRDGFDTEEAILVRLADGVVAFENYCPHWTDVRLDKGSGATMRDAELVCEKHGATFESDTGTCTFGPCEGAVLEEIAVAVDDGAVYLTDDRYEFEQQGPSGDHDRSSRGRIGFSGQ